MPLWRAVLERTSERSCRVSQPVILVGVPERGDRTKWSHEDRGWRVRASRGGIGW